MNKTKKTLVAAVMLVCSGCATGFLSEYALQENKYDDRVSSIKSAGLDEKEEVILCLEGEMAKNPPGEFTVKLSGDVRPYPKYQTTTGHIAVNLPRNHLSVGCKDNPTNNRIEAINLEDGILINLPFPYDAGDTQFLVRWHDYKEKNAPYLLALSPITLAVDIVTLPIQVVAVLYATMHDSP